MKKLALFLALILIAPEVLAAPRVIRVSHPIPYNRSVNPFVRPYYGHYGRGYNRYYNRYYGSNLIRPYYYGNTFGRIYNGNYYPVYQDSSYYRVSETPEVQDSETCSCEDEKSIQDRMFKNVFTMRRKLYMDSEKNENLDLSYNTKSLSEDEINSIINVSETQKVVKDPRLSLVEKNVYGKSFEHQSMNLRLNRLEKEMFNKTFPTMEESERINNIFVNYNANSISDKELSKIEKNVFNRTYSEDSVPERISRIEEEIFGTIQSGNLDKRLKKVETALLAQQQKTQKPQVSQYDACYGGYMPQTGWRNTLGRASRFFTGYPTGITPPIPSMPPFGMGGSGIHQGFTDNWGGYAYNNTTRGGGMGVHIID